MATGGLHPILRFIRELVRLDDSGDRADAEVVERFAAYGGEAAFAAIVERHGPMVFGDGARANEDYARPSGQEVKGRLHAIIFRQKAVLQPELYGVTKH